MLDISIVVHGPSPYIIPCLESIKANTQLPFHVHLVANTGEDEVIRRIRTLLPEPEITVNDAPRSFAANHNYVMSVSQQPYVALLNDDTIVQKGALDALVAFLETHPDAGLVGPRLLNPDMTLQPSTFGDPTYGKVLFRLLGLNGLLLAAPVARRTLEKMLRPLFPRTLARYWDHDQVAEAEILSGAAMVVRRTAFDQVGPMAEVTRAYGEENDWHLRFRQAGWKLYLVPEATIIHYEGQSSGGQKAMLAEAYKSILYYFCQHRSSREWELLRWTVIVIQLASACMTLLTVPFRRDWRARYTAHRDIARMARTWSARGDNSGCTTKPGD